MLSIQHSLTSPVIKYAHLGLAGVNLPNQENSQRTFLRGRKKKVGEGDWGPKSTPNNKTFD